MKRLVLIFICVNFASCNIHIRIKRPLTGIAEPNSLQPRRAFDSTANVERIRVLPGLRDGPCPKINTRTPNKLMEKFTTGTWHWEWYLDSDYGTLWTKNRLRCLYSKLTPINNSTNAYEDYAIDSITNQQIIDRGEYRWSFDGTILVMTSVIPGPYYRGLYFGTIGASGTNYYQYVASDPDLNDYVIWYSCREVGDKHTAVGTISTRNEVTPSTMASIASAIARFPALEPWYFFRVSKAFDDWETMTETAETLNKEVSKKFDTSRKNNRIYNKITVNMTTDDIIADNLEEEGAMDRILFLIKDKLPKSVVEKLYDALDNLKGVRNIVDMVAFVLIEFNTKDDADAARSRGFEYILNGETIKASFTNQGVVAVYMKAACRPGIGVGHD